MVTLTKTVVDELAGLIAVELQSRNQFTDIATMRAIVDDAMRSVFGKFVRTEWQRQWYNRVEEMRERAKGLEDEALRRAGWRSSSNYPHSIWLWQHSHIPIARGEHIEVRGVSRDQAVLMQKMIESREYARLHPEEFNKEREDEGY